MISCMGSPVKATVVSKAYMPLGVFIPEDSQSKAAVFAVMQEYLAGFIHLAALDLGGEFIGCPDCGSIDRFRLRPIPAAMAYDSGCRDRKLFCLVFLSDYPYHIIAIRFGKRFARLAQIVADRAAKAVLLKAFGLLVHVPGGRA